MLINYKYVGWAYIYYIIVVKMSQNDMFVYFANAFGQNKSFQSVRLGNSWAIPNDQIGFKT